MGAKASHEQKSRGLDTDNEILISQLNRIVCSKIAQTIDADLEKMNSPDYCKEITVLTKDALTKYMQSQTAEDKKNVYLLKGQIRPPEASLEKQKLCDNLAARYMLIYKIYQLVRATVGHVGSVQSLCGQITPKAKEFGGGYCQERLQAMAFRADSAISESTLSSKLCRLPSAASVGTPPWAKKLDDLLSSMKQTQTSQITDLNRAIGKHDAATALTGASVQKFADIKQIDHSLSVPTGVCTDPDDKRLPNAYYEFQIKDPTLLRKYQEIVKDMESGMDSAALRLSAVLRQIFIGFDKPAGQLTINPALTAEKLQGLANETKNTVVAMLIGCDAQYSKAMNMFAAIVTDKLGDYASTAADARDAANKEVKTISRGYPGYSSGYYQPDSSSLKKQARLDTYSPRFRGIPASQAKDTPSIQAKAYDMYDSQMDKHKLAAEVAGLDQYSLHRDHKLPQTRHTDYYGLSNDPLGLSGDFFGRPMPPIDYSKLMPSQFTNPPVAKTGLADVNPGPTAAVAPGTEASLDVKPAA